jgi:hypothetical protein
MKSFALLIFLFLAVPGSGRLAWDGIPFSTRIEFATLVVFVVALLSATGRDAIRSALARARWSGVARPALVLLILVKLLTFAWSPFSQGFDTCYRSLYNPLTDPIACEKSYEGPFLRRSDLGLTNTSRIDNSIDFGVHQYDWSLPFMNEYPRLGALWLERFPFTATFGTTLNNDRDSDLYLPIYGNGEVSATLGATRLDTTDIPIVDRYMFPRLNLLRVPNGLSELTINYRYSDDDLDTPPEQAPPRRGPYAQLKVGNPVTRSELLQLTKLHVRGWSVDIARNRTPSAVIATNALGDELARSDPQSRPDVAEYVGKPTLVESGFSLMFDASEVIDGDVLISAVFADRTEVIGVLKRTTNVLPEMPEIELRSESSRPAGLHMWLDADRSRIETLTPGVRQAGPLSLRALLVLLDAASAAIAAVLLLAGWLAIRRSLITSLGLMIASILLIFVGRTMAPVWFGTRLFIPLVALSVLVFLAMRNRKASSALVFLPTAYILAHHKVFDHLERFHTSRGERWWGKLLYYWRDSDWYATQGFARRIFVEGSLEGGESLFWFQAGPRYLAFLTRILLGENDVLVGLLMTTLGFWTFIVLMTHFVGQYQDRVAWSFAFPLLLIGLLFMSEDLIAGFGFVGSSEYPTWILLFALTGFIIRAQRDSRSWLLVSIAIALAYAIQLRPNQIGGIVLLFLVSLTLVDRSDTTRAITLASRMIVAFTVVASLSLLHNLYYAETFVPFTGNAGINYQFSWLDVFGLREGPDGLGAVWQQLRFMMYWTPLGNWAWAFAFWGSQLAWLFVLTYRARQRVLLRARSLLLLIPFGYAIPMLKYQMGSYYPRHLVAINLAFMCAALMAWPRHDETARDAEAETTESTTNLVSA